MVGVTLLKAEDVVANDAYCTLQLAVALDSELLRTWFGTLELTNHSGESSFLSSIDQVSSSLFEAE